MDKGRLLDRLHPEQYRLRRPFISTVEKLFRNRKLPGVTESDVRTIVNELSPAYNRAIMQRPFEDRPAGSHRMMGEVSLAAHYGTFLSYGRQVYHFPEHLSESFRQTDIDDVPGGAIKLPHPVIYLHFEPQEDLDIFGTGDVVDGAYLSAIPTSDATTMLQIIVTVARGDRGKTEGLWPFDHLGRYYYLAVEIEPDAPFVKSIEKAFKKDVEESLSRGRNDPSFYSTPWGNIVNRSGKTALEHAASLDSGFPSFQSALRLIVNGLCFLSAYPEHIESKWEDGAPEDLVERAATGRTNQQRFLAKKELQKQGYLFIHMGKIDPKSAIPSKHATDEQTVINRRSMHWRRGHWRNQAYGPGWKEHRLVWIMPMLVNSQSENVSDAGHIYMV